MNYFERTDADKKKKKRKTKRINDSEDKHTFSMCLLPESHKTRGCLSKENKKSADLQHVLSLALS